MKLLYKSAQNKGHKYLDSGIPTLPQKSLSINRSSDTDNEENPAQS